MGGSLIATVTVCIFHKCYMLPCFSVSSVILYLKCLSPLPGYLCRLRGTSVVARWAFWFPVHLCHPLACSCLFLCVAENGGKRRSWRYSLCTELLMCCGRFQRDNAPTWIGPLLLDKWIPKCCHDTRCAAFTRTLWLLYDFQPRQALLKRKS